MLENNLLIHEHQLGETLSKCIHQERRADFSLMLAMLTDDIREHSEFLLPEHAPDTTDDETTSSLRKAFDVPAPQDLGLKSPEHIGRFNQAELVENQFLDTVRLTQVLSPNPLSFRDDSNFINSQIIENTSLHCQRRLKGGVSVDKMDLNANAWLKAIKSQRQDQPALVA
ncbi:VC2046/SO_2500 family protein [Thalassotalea euphylliae]|uniref:VC2046/SO_2500 family protein n=1 Tax=Thalassotalea euphylliae TaxID=1655234 RepID=UPI00362BA630